MILNHMGTTSSAAGRRGVAGDPNFASVSALLHMDGIGSPTSFIDSSLNNFTVTASGNATKSASQIKFGDASCQLDGVGDYLSLPAHPAFHFGNGASGRFTIEAFVYVISLSQPAMILDLKGGVVGNVGSFYISTDGFLTVGVGAGFSDNDILVPTGEWVHIAWARNGADEVRSFVNGVRGGVLLDLSGIDVGADARVPRIGISSTDLSSSPFNGYIEELRITKGVTRYTTNFTPPTSPFPDS